MKLTRMFLAMTIAATLAAVDSASLQSQENQLPFPEGAARLSDSS